jgi:hypothetical protein
MTNEELKIKLVAILSNKRWATLSATDLDVGFSTLTPEEKQVIVDSLRAGDDNAKNLIKRKLQLAVDVYAQSLADAYIAQGFIPNESLPDLLA